LEKIIFENFNISENNIISVELAKLLGYPKKRKHWPCEVVIPGWMPYMGKNFKGIAATCHVKKLEENTYTHT
jgi:hypothetical protein